MPQTRPKLRPQEARILKVLLEHSYSLNTTQVADRANVSWNTSDKYLKRFYRKRWVSKKTRGNRIYWKANR
jgi:predicted transcriptional regulator